jgi:hypothetical protein
MTGRTWRVRWLGQGADTAARQIPDPPTHEGGPLVMVNGTLWKVTDYQPSGDAGAVTALLWPVDPHDVNPTLTHWPMLPPVREVLP